MCLFRNAIVKQQHRLESLDGSHANYYYSMEEYRFSPVVIKTGDGPVDPIPADTSGMKCTVVIFMAWKKNFQVVTAALMAGQTYHRKINISVRVILKLKV